MKLSQKFQELKDKNEAALILYLTAGFPTLEASMSQIKNLSESGADIIEIGIPFSDPIADGPTIQYASQVALKQHVNLKQIIQGVKTLDIETPLVMLSYINPLLAYGLDRLLQDMKDARFEGLIVPDLPVEEAHELCKRAEIQAIDNVFLVTPNSTQERIRLATQKSTGFVYCVSLTGTTGMRNGFSSSLMDFIGKVKLTTKKPIAVGFGISTPQQVRELSHDVDGIIIGSRIIEAIRKKEDIGTLVHELKVATRR